MVEVFKIAWLNTKSSEARNWIEVGWALEETIARLDMFVMWGKLVDAEGTIMQRDRDEFKKANYRCLAVA